MRESRLTRFPRFLQGPLALPPLAPKNMQAADSPDRLGPRDGGETGGQGVATPSYPFRVIGKSLRGPRARGIYRGTVYVPERHTPAGSCPTDWKIECPSRPQSNVPDPSTSELLRDDAGFDGNASGKSDLPKVHSVPLRSLCIEAKLKR